MEIRLCCVLWHLRNVAMHYCCIGGYKMAHGSCGCKYAGMDGRWFGWASCVFLMASVPMLYKCRNSISPDGKKNEKRKKK